jgi:hypothetical protein
MPGCSLIALTLTLRPQSRALSPSSPRRDYAKTISMIFGAAPSFEEIMASIDEIDACRQSCSLTLRRSSTITAV